MVDIFLDYLISTQYVCIHLKPVFMQAIVGTWCEVVLFDFDVTSGGRSYFEVGGGGGGGGGHVEGSALSPENFEFFNLEIACLVPNFGYKKQL